MKYLKIADNLVHLRHQRGITQEVLADFLGVSKASVSKWETGISLPDISQLPKIAAYYDVTIDELMGYEAQLTMKEIKSHYEKFAEDFSKRDFGAVWEEVREFIRQYYACYPALLQIIVLMMNHYTMADVSVQKDILAELVKMCEHIQKKCADANVCTNALIFQATIELLSGHPEITIEKLKRYQEPMGGITGADVVLIQAYQMSGRMEDAMEWNQVTMFRHVLELVENSVLYLMANLDNREAADMTIERMERVAEVYDLSKLHPNAYLKILYSKALYNAHWDMETQALEALRGYVRGAVHFMEHGAYLHGDAYFDRLDGYFKKMEDYNMLPRNPKTVLASIGQDLEHPLFEKLRGNEEFEKLRSSQDCN